MPHTFFSFYVQIVASIEELPFREDEMLQDPNISFLLPSYVEAQVLALESLSSLPSHIFSQGYDLGFKIHIDDEPLEIV
jgi:hypothetical protein